MNREREEAIQVLQTALTSPLIYGEYADAIGMAVEELKAPTGFISKQDVKWQIQEWINELSEAIDMLDSIPSADPKTGWIPVSEKPKDEERTYLVQHDGGGMCSCRWTNVNPFWTELTTDWHWNIFDIPQYCKVVAWMDLEPYREDSEV